MEDGTTYVYQDSKNVYVVTDKDSEGEARRAVEDRRSSGDSDRVKIVSSDNTGVVAIPKGYLAD